MSLEIRADIPAYMRDLRTWLEDTKDVPLEEMDSFFSARINVYEAHMSPWAAAYAHMAALLPPGIAALLDLGCGTGLELEPVFRRFPDLAVTGIDLSQAMLEKLREKFPSKHLTLRCGDYFTADLGNQCFDAVISFESLHHFSAQAKTALLRKVYAALRPGGVFLEADYIACCQEEETLLTDACARKRAAAGISPEVFVHFDTPLTLEHECACLLAAGFPAVETPASIAGATFLLAKKPAAT